MPHIPIEDVLGDPARLAALEATHLLDSPPEAAFDRYTRLAARLLRVPTTLLSLVAADRQFFKSIGGRPEAWAGGREAPLTYSLCQFVVARGAPVIISDTQRDSPFADNPNFNQDVRAYAGIPIATPDGQTIGAFCAIDSEPHNWTDDELEILGDLAASIRAEIALRAELEREHQVEAALRESEARFRTFVESLGEGLLITDLDDRVLYVNQRMTELSGFDAEELLGRPAYELLLPHDRWPELHTRNVQRRAGQAEMYTSQMLRKDGTIWWAAVTASPLRNADGTIIGTLGAINDVTARLAAEAERDRLLGELQTALDRMEALYTISTRMTNIEDLDQLLHTVTDSAARTLPADRVTVVLLAPAAQQVTHLIAGGPGADHIVTVSYAELQEGLTGWVLRTGQLANSPKGRPDPRESHTVQARRVATACGAILVAPLIYQGQVIGTITAINRPDQPDFSAADEHLLGALAGQAAVALAQARLYQTAQQQAATDALTGLCNRRAFFAQGERLLERGRAAGRPPVLLVLDVDRFKSVNDTYGHPVGDVVLREVAARCAAGVRPGDLVGRIGGEEFAVLLVGAGPDEAELVAERLRQAVAAAPVPTPAGPIPVTISLGVSSGDGGEPAASSGQALAVLLAAADTALYAAKAAGRNRVVIRGHGGLQVIKNRAWSPSMV